jgi:hypothetical protein
VHACRLDADDERCRDLAVGVAAGDEGQDLRLARNGTLVSVRDAPTAMSASA